MAVLVKTPLGAFPQAGLARRALAALTDLLFAAALLLVIASPLSWLLEPQASQLPVFIAAPIAVLPFVYAILAGRTTFPSVGFWATGVRRWPYSELEEYAGKGSEVVRVAAQRVTVARTVAVWGLIYSTLFGLEKLATWFGAAA